MPNPSENYLIHIDLETGGLNTSHNDIYPLIPEGKGKQPTLKPDHSYELDTWAENSEVYEFTTRSRLDWTCQVYILDNLSSMSMKCFPKPNSIDYNLN